MTLRQRFEQITAEAPTTLAQEHVVRSVGKSCTQLFLTPQQSRSVLPQQIIYDNHRPKLPDLGDISISCYRNKYCINFSKMSVIPSDSSGCIYTTCTRQLYSTRVERKILQCYISIKYSKLNTASDSATQMETDNYTHTKQ